MVRILGTNQLPQHFSQADVESLAECTSCGSFNTELIYSEFGLGIEVCHDCGMVRTNPRLRQSAILRCYEENAKGQRVFSDMFANGNRRTFSWRGATARYRTLSKQLRHVFRTDAMPRLLEIGFGGGDFISQLKSAGFDVHGFDVSRTGVDNLKAKGIEATYADSLEAAAFPPNSFDMVVMWEVFEHIPDPASFAKEVLRIIRPGGFWFLQVPNWRWLDLKTKIVSKLPGRKSYLSKYGYIGPLFHLYHYTHESLDGLLGRIGFRFHYATRIRPYGETNWTPLIAHEIFYVADTIPAITTGNRKHFNVVLCELYQKPLRQ